MSEAAQALLARMKDGWAVLLTSRCGQNVAHFVNDWPDGTLARTPDGLIVTYGEAELAALVELSHAEAVLMDVRRFPEVVYITTERAKEAGVCQD